MVDLSIILAGFSDAFSVTNLLFVLFGVALDPLVAISFLVGVNKGGLVGGAIPAVLMNTPGTPDAAATAIDGYPLAKQGKPLKATKMALFSSITGDTFSDIVLITVAAPLAILALKMGPIEIFALMIFTFSVLAGLIGTSLIKGIIAAALGLLVASIGSDPEHFTPRLMFGYWELFDGLPLPSVAIGMLAISEILRRMTESHGTMRSAINIDMDGDPDDRRVTWAEYWGCRYTMLRGATIGTVLGALPGIGSTAAAFMSYAFAKASSKDPSSFGKGNLHGIAATESANSAVVGANLIPLLTLGIPGSVGAALIISAFMIHGMQPGPLLFETQGQLVYGLFGAMIMANFVNLWVGQIGLRFWVKVVSVPESLIFSSALLLCFVRVSMATNGLFGVAIMLMFAVLGYVMTSFGYSIVIFIIAFFLGPRFEKSISQSLALTKGDLLLIYQSPVAMTLLILSIVSFFWFLKRTKV
jgi:putative tricarboxylic transport membrane protein